MAVAPVQMAEVLMQVALAPVQMPEDLIQVAAAIVQVQGVLGKCLHLIHPPLLVPQNLPHIHPPYKKGSAPKVSQVTFPVQL